MSMYVKSSACRQHVFIAASLKASLLLVLVHSQVGAEETIREKPGPSSTATAEERELAEFAIQELWDGVEQLRSGKVRIEEVNTDKNRRHGPPQRTYDYFLAFDHERDLLRFDRQGPRRKSQHGKSQYARDEGKSLLYIPPRTHPGHVSIHKREWEIEIEFAKPFDIRLIGLVSYGGFVGRTTFRKYKEFQKEIAVSALEDCRRTEKDRIRITWQYRLKNGNRMPLLRSLWLDETRGYRPVKMDFKAKPDPAMDDWQPLATTTTRWKQTENVWVPQSCRLVAHRPARVSELKFDWESVNEGIERKLVEIEGFDLPDGTKVVNKKVGAPVIERTIGE